MNEQFTNHELKLSLDNLKEQVKLGFEGIHKRQDITNGNVVKNTEFRSEYKRSIESLIGDRERKFVRYSDIIWKIVTGLIITIIGIEKIANYIK